MSTNLIVGIMEGFEFEEGRCQLEPGDTLFTYTDGVSEAMDVNLEMFGEDRMKASLAKVPQHTCQQIIDTVKADVAAFVGEAEQSDDITMLVVKRLA